MTPKKRYQQTRKILAKKNEKALLADGLEDALIGYARLNGKPTLALYDLEECLKIFMRDGTTHEDASEFFEYNTIGAYMGESTPAFAILSEEGITLAEENEEAVLLDGFTDALIGYLRMFGKPVLALYDLDEYLQILMDRDDMTHLDAVASFEQSLVATCVGESAPAFAVLTKEGK